MRETGPRINHAILSTEIRLIGADGGNVGVVSPAEAMELANEAGLDLVEISPNATPPVCKVMDFGNTNMKHKKKKLKHGKNRR